MNEEEFLEHVAEAIESCMDIASAEVVEGTRALRVQTGEGDRFVLAVRRSGALPEEAFPGNHDDE
jgi:hypothetical protein